MARIFAPETGERLLFRRHRSIEAPNIYRIRYLRAVFLAPILEDGDSGSWGRVVCDSADFSFWGLIEGEVSSRRLLGIPLFQRVELLVPNSRKLTAMTITYFI